MGHVTIIAELGSNPAPAWDFEPWCAAAAAAGADAVKVQLFRADHFPQAERASKRTLAFPRARLTEFVICAHAYGLTTGASVFDADAMALAAEYCDWLKLAAREQDNELLFSEWWVKYYEKRLYRSIDRLTNSSSLSGQTTLYAIQRYPAPMGLSLLRVVQMKREMHRVPWGWSSHTRGTLDCMLAASLGAVVIEKHLALTNHDIEAGHSLLPDKFAVMCRAIRKVERHGN